MHRLGFNHFWGWFVFLLFNLTISVQAAARAPQQVAQSISNATKSAVSRSPHAQPSARSLEATTPQTRYPSYLRSNWAVMNTDFVYPRDKHIAKILSKFNDAKRDIRAALYGTDNLEVTRLSIDPQLMLNTMVSLSKKPLGRVDIVDNQPAHVMMSLMKYLGGKEAVTDHVGKSKLFGWPNNHMILRMHSYHDPSTYKKGKWLPLPEGPTAYPDDEVFMVGRSFNLFDKQLVYPVVGKPPLFSKEGHLIRPGRITGIMPVSIEKSGQMMGTFYSQSQVASLGLKPPSTTQSVGQTHKRNKPVNVRAFAAAFGGLHSSADDVAQFLHGAAHYTKVHGVSAQKIVDFLWSLKEPVSEKSKAMQYTFTKNNCFSTSESLCAFLGGELESHLLGGKVSLGSVEPTIIDYLTEVSSPTLNTPPLRGILSPKPLVQPGDEVFYVRKRNFPNAHGYLVVGKPPQKGKPGHVTATVTGAAYSFTGKYQLKIYAPPPEMKVPYDIEYLYKYNKLKNLVPRVDPSLYQLPHLAKSKPMLTNVAQQGAVLPKLPQPTMSSPTSAIPVM